MRIISKEKKLLKNSWENIAGSADSRLSNKKPCQIESHHDALIKFGKLLKSDTASDKVIGPALDYFLNLCDKKTLPLVVDRWLRSIYSEDKKVLATHLIFIKELSRRSDKTYAFQYYRYVATNRNEKKPISQTKSETETIPKTIHDSKNESKTIVPNFSKSIESEFPNFFFNYGFKLVKRSLYHFAVLLSFLITLVTLFGYIFFLNISAKGTGIIEPQNYIAVRSQLSGMIEKILVKNGDYVHKGDKLAKFSDYEYIVKIAQAEKNLEAAKADLKSRYEKNKISDGIIVKNIKDVKKIRAKTNGIVNKILVDKGDRVKKGDLLVKISDTELKSQLSLKTKDLEIAKINLQSIEKNYALSKSIYKNYIPEIDDGKNNSDISDIRAQKAVVNKCLGQIEYLEKQIKNTKITAPCRGIVLSSNLKDNEGAWVSNGEIILTIGTHKLKNSHEISTLPEIQAQQSIVQKLSKEIELLQHQLEKTNMYAPISGNIISPDLSKRIGSTITPGESLMLVSNLDKWVVKVLIKETDIPKIALNDEAKVKLNAFPFMHFKMFKGKVVDIAKLPGQDLNSYLKENKLTGYDATATYYTVTIALSDSFVIKNNRKYRFQLGLVADANIILSKKRITSYIFDIFIGKINFFDDFSTANKNS
jgi:multidrug resistance efflux pump